MRKYVICKSCGRIFAPLNYDTKQKFCSRSCALKGGVRHIPVPTAAQRPQLTLPKESWVPPVTKRELSEAVQNYFAQGGEITQLPPGSSLAPPVDAQPQPSSLGSDVLSRLEQQEQYSTRYSGPVVPDADRKLMGVIQSFRNRFGG